MREENRRGKEGKDTITKNKQVKTIIFFYQLGTGFCLKVEKNLKVSENALLFLLKLSFLYPPKD